MDSRFLLSHIRHYPLLQERSLDFARDDDTGIALSKHIRCTLREINPFFPTIISSAARTLPCTPLFLAPFTKGFPVFRYHTYGAIHHTVISSAARNLPCTPSFLASFAKGFPFPLSRIGRYTSIQERSLHFGRDDGTRIAIYKHIRYTLREINPFPHTVISSAVEKSFLHSGASCSFR